MKMLFFFTFLFVGCFAAPPSQIVQYKDDHNLDSYNYSFQSSDGTYRAENGQLNYAGTKDEALSVSGVFQYIGPDGLTYTVNYVADENGFRATGDHLPKFP